MNRFICASCSNTNPNFSWPYNLLLSIVANYSNNVSLRVLIVHRYFNRIVISLKNNFIKQRSKATSMAITSAKVRFSFILMNQVHASNISPLWLLIKAQSPHKPWMSMLASILHLIRFGPGGFQMSRLFIFSVFKL